MSYGFEEHLARYGSGENMLRTERLAQPRALKVGDILATGIEVWSPPPQEGYNGSIKLHLSSGRVEVAARFPIALHVSGKNTHSRFPSELKQGDIIATGDAVLSPPLNGPRGFTQLHLTGGYDGHWIDVPEDIPIALLTEEDNAPKELWNYAEKNAPRPAPF